MSAVAPRWRAAALCLAYYVQVLLCFGFFITRNDLLMLDVFLIFDRFGDTPTSPLPNCDPHTCECPGETKSAVQQQWVCRDPSMF